jgi:hypothetical protein
MKPSCFLVAVASITLCRAAFAQDASPGGTCANGGWLCWSATVGHDIRPSDGIDALAGGSALLAIGTLSFATAPICKSGVVNLAQQDSCFTASFVIGAPFLALGIPLIVFGAAQNAKYKDWARRHPTLTGLTVSPTSGGGAVAWSGRF